MKALFFAVIGLLLTNICFAQHVYQINADTVRIYNSCDTAELVLENHTQDTLGFLYNKGKGRTEFRRLQLASVGTGKLAILGQDTVDLDLGNNYIRNQLPTTQTADFNISGQGRAASYNATYGYGLGNYAFQSVAGDRVQFYYGPGSRTLLQFASNGAAGFGTPAFVYAVSINCSDVGTAQGLQLSGMTTVNFFRGETTDSLLVINPASNLIKYASPKKMVSAALNTGILDFPAGTTSVVVNTTAVTANSRIFLTVQEIGCSDCSTTPMVITRSAGTSFTVRCLKDASVSAKVAWMIVEPG